MYERRFEWRGESAGPKSSYKCTEYREQTIAFGSKTECGSALTCRYRRYGLGYVRAKRESAS